MFSKRQLRILRNASALSASWVSPLEGEELKASALRLNGVLLKRGYGAQERVEQDAFEALASSLVERHQSMIDGWISPLLGKYRRAKQAAG